MTEKALTPMQSFQENLRDKIRDDIALGFILTLFM